MTNVYGYSLQFIYLFIFLISVSFFFFLHEFVTILLMIAKIETAQPIINRDWSSELGCTQTVE